MKDFYHILDIEGTASKEDIKRAYFKGIRKYPPERCPKEFMDIREAYEALYNESTRKQYDDMKALPPIVMAYYQQALKEMEEHRPAESIVHLERVKEVYPELSLINALLGDAYLANDNSGKAIQTFEELAKKEPSNASFSGKLAKSYLARGWQKKAMNKYVIALKLDEDNISLWRELSYCYFTSRDFKEARKVLEQGIATAIRNDWDGTELCCLALYIDSMLSNREQFQKSLERVKTLANKDDLSRSNAAWFLAHFSQQLRDMGESEFSEWLISSAAELLPNDLQIQEMKDKALIELELDNSWSRFEEDEGYDDLLVEALGCFIDACDNPECGSCMMDCLDYEIGLVTNLRKIKPQLMRLKKDYPKLYEKKKDLFDEILSAKNEENYYKKHSKRIKKTMNKFQHIMEEDIYMDADEYDEYSSHESETYVREEKKIGRNDPCPCGSGKKYKRCCGKG